VIPVSAPQPSFDFIFDPDHQTPDQSPTLSIMALQVWLLTGCTSGSGLSLAHAISARGDLVIATGRSITNRLPSPSSPNITLLDLDITSPLASIRETITTAISIHGRIDVLVNNAGISRLAALEEMSEEMLRGVFEVNLFGAVKMTQAVLPHMRSRKDGTVVFVGAGMGWVGLPFLGGYSMSKAALTSKCLFLFPLGPWRARKMNPRE